MIDLFKRAKGFDPSLAVRDAQGTFSYQDLNEASAQIAFGLLALDFNPAGERIAFMAQPGFDYVATLWGIWKSGAIAVPLCLSHPPKSLAYVLEDSSPILAVADKTYQSTVEPLAKEHGLEFCTVDQLKASPIKQLPQLNLNDPALILYTSGTTSKPKGVVISHKNIEAQVKSLVEAWEWNSDDQILNVLPLHHVHGIVNVVTCALWSGATCQFLPKFDAEEVFEVFKKGEINVFMAVPTIYYKLIRHWENLSTDVQQSLKEVMKKFRLMVSGSAALPVSTLEKWQEASGHILLERYGMTEIGMALSNSYHGERKPGHVGQPLPGVSLRLVNEKGEELATGPGEIQVKGDSVFSEYWNKLEATANAFIDGWFKTGDIAQLNEDSYKILGRSSVDIIKSGGYKISALEIEEVLLSHPDIDECAVVGLPDEEWGEIVSAALVGNHKQLEQEIFVNWMKHYLPSYKIPKSFLYLDSLPRNALGKVTKNELKKLFKSR